MPGDTGRDRGSADGGDGGANDSGDSRDRDNDSDSFGNEDGFSDPVTGKEISRADANAYDRGEYSGNRDDVAAALMGWNAEPLGIIGTRELVSGTRQRAAANMSLGGMSDRDISQALANWGAGYTERAKMLGPIDAISAGPFTNALSGVLSKAVAVASPVAGLASSLGDSAIKGNLTGNYGGLGATLGGLAGSRFGAMIGGDLSQSIGGALAGLAAGGLAGSAFGRAIGEGQGSMANVGDLSSMGRDNQQRQVGLRPQRRQSMPVQQPMMSPSVALQLLGMRGFGV